MTLSQDQVTDGGSLNLIVSWSTMDDVLLHCLRHVTSMTLSIQLFSDVDEQA